MAIFTIPRCTRFAPCSKTTRLSIKGGIVAVLVLLASSCPAPVASQWRSALYPADWTPSFTVSGGKFLHDFSYAGYHNGPDLPGKDGAKKQFSVTDYGADTAGQQDSVPAIQSAIDAAASNGGGVVYFPAGLYRCDSPLLITTSNTVLRGAGPDASRLYFTQSAGMSYKGHILFQGAVTTKTQIPLKKDGENRSFDVFCTAGGLAPGDEVSVGWYITDAFVAEHGMTGTWQAFNGQWQSIFRRMVIEVDTSAHPNRVTLDVPLRYPAKLRDNAGLRVETGYLEECGIEDLGIANAVTWADAWAEMQVRAIEFEAVKDCWIRNVESFASPNAGADGYHLQNCGIRVLASKRVTIADCRLEKAQNRGSGGCGYLFEVSQSNEVLVRDCTAREGRHNFIQNWGFGTTGCVFLRCKSAGSTNVLSADVPIGLPAFCEYHHSLAMACLVDSCELDDGWYGGNRKDESTGAGQTVTQNAYWNISGGGVIRSYAYGEGYVIGTRGVAVQTGLTDPRANGTAPQDYVEGAGIGAKLEPQSLYEDQLARRTKSTAP